MNFRNDHVVIILIIIIVFVFIFNFDVYVITKNEPICKPIYVTKKVINKEMKQESLLEKNINQEFSNFKETFNNLSCNLNIPDSTLTKFSVQGINSTFKKNVIDSVISVLSNIPTDMDNELIKEIIEYFAIIYETSLDIHDFYNNITNSTKINKDPYNTKYARLVLYLINKFDNDYSCSDELTSNINNSKQQEPTPTPTPTPTVAPRQQSSTLSPTCPPTQQSPTFLPIQQWPGGNADGKLSQIQFVPELAPTFPPMQQSIGTLRPQSPTFPSMQQSPTFPPMQQSIGTPRPQSPTFPSMQQSTDTPRPQSPTFPSMQQSTDTPRPQSPTFPSMQHSPTFPSMQQSPTFPPMQQSIGTPRQQSPTFPSMQQSTDTPKQQSPTFPSMQQSPTFPSMQQTPEFLMQQSPTFPPMQQLTPNMMNLPSIQPQNMNIRNEAMYTTPYNGKTENIKDMIDKLSVISSEAVKKCKLIKPTNNLKNNNTKTENFTNIDTYNNAFMEHYASF
jgi:hypothetical protein